MSLVGTASTLAHNTQDRSVARRHCIHDPVLLLCPVG